MSNSADPKPDYELYRYTPNLEAAAIFAVLFAGTTIVHIYQLVKSKAWYFVPFVVGGVFEIIGYITRIKAHSNTKSIPIYSIQTILILLAPALFAASIYMVLGRLIIALDAERLSPIRSQWMTKIFVCGDVVAFLGQAVGGGVMASGALSALSTGEHITVAGLCVQLLFFSVFIFVSTIFHRRFNASAPAASLKVPAKSMFRHRNWETVLYVLYATSALILIRSAFRVIEFAMGNDGELLSHEAYAYIFDSTLMFFAMVTFNIFHPASVLGGKVTAGSAVGIALNSM